MIARRLPRAWPRRREGKLMPARLEIFMELATLHTVLADFARVENAVTRVNRASRAVAAGRIDAPGQFRAAEFRLAAAQLGRVAAVATAVTAALVGLAEGLHNMN